MKKRPVPSGVNPVELRRVSSLDEPNRRRLYDFVVAAGEPVTRDEAAAALRLDRSLVAYHLDKLVDEGLLSTSFARPDGRGGPGAGRPAKRYERADDEVAVSLPPRDYRLVAELLARAVETDRSGGVRYALRQAAADLGGELVDRDDGDGREGLVAHLARHGFQPYEDDGVIRLRNCPFRDVAREHTTLVCGMNLALLTGLSEALDCEVSPQLDPRSGHCCVTF